MEIVTAYCSVINLAKAIVKTAEEATHDPYLSRMAERAKAVEGRFIKGETDAAEALERLFRGVELNEERKNWHVSRPVAG